MSHDAMVMLQETDAVSEISLELLDRLHELLEESGEVPAIQGKIYELVQWVEAHVSPPLGDDDNIHPEQAPGAAYSDEFFATLMFQAQQQNQQ
jgi:hypothetical protein